MIDQRDLLAMCVIAHLAVIAAIADLMLLKAAFLQARKLPGSDVTLSGNDQ